MNKLLMFLFSFIMLFTFGCDSDDTITGGVIDPEPELLGCEAASFYDWTDFEFSTSLDGGANTWIAFDFDETTLFSIDLNQAGFQCLLFEACDGENGSPPPLYNFQTNGNGIDVGIVTEGLYYLEIVNTRPNRLDFTFGISLSDIVYGCLNNNATNYNPDANVGDGSCQFNDCNTEWLTSAYGETILDCDGNCSPLSWIGDGWCDDGAYGIYATQEAYEGYQNCVNEGNEDCSGFTTPINLWCPELNWDEGDCEAIPGQCTEGLIEDCNGICGPVDWLGDGECDDGTYQFNGNQIFFNCEEFNNDEGDCDVLQRSIQKRPLPNGRVKIQ